MQAAYGIDVTDPAVSTRRVHVLLERLPPSARRGGESWSVEAELLAGLIDQVAELTWVTLRVNGSKNAARPKPVPRPDRRPQRPAPPRGQLENGQPPPVQAGTWMDAARQLAAIPGVVVKDDG